LEGSSGILEKEIFNGATEKMILKRNVYVRRWVCAICKQRVIARYDRKTKCWGVKCECGTGYDKTLFGNSMIWERIDKGSYPIDG